MPEEHGSRPIAFGIMNEHEFKPVGQIDESEFKVPAPYWAPDTQRINDVSGSLTLNLDCDMEGILEAVIGTRDAATRAAKATNTLSLVFERLIRRKYRHEFVWQYRRERKGNKTNRRGTRSYAAVHRTVFLPNLEAVPCDGGFTLKGAIQDGGE